MMWLMAANIIGYQVVLGVFIAMIMIIGIGFAKTCEFLVDFFFTKK